VVISNAPEHYDTLGEVAEFLEAHEVEATRRDQEIDTIEEKVKVIEETIVTDSSG
jgi:hypothetical protein